MISQNKSFAKYRLTGLILIVLLSGCTSMAEKPDDPWEDWNRSTQDFNEDFDNTFMKPLATGYLFTTPESVDRGVSNFFSNIDDIGVTINDILQFKFIQAGMDMSRLIINSTVGIAGIMDVATQLDLPKHNEDFEQTLGVWGVPSGPYLILPFWGPSSPRGVAGLIGDAIMDPLNYTIFASLAVSTVGTLADVVNVTDQRAGFMTAEKIVDEAAINRYDFIKSSYQQRRQYLISDGHSSDDIDVLAAEMDFYDDEPTHKLELSSPEE